MSKPDSGHFHGANGKGGGNPAPPLFDNNGHVTYEGIAAHREEFMGKSVEQIAEMLKENGYEFNIHPSNRQNRGSTAQIIEITNPTKERNINQIQVSPDGSRHHGNVPYVKISTSNEGLIKVIDGTREQYRTDGTEKARLIFRRDDND